MMERIQANPPVGLTFDRSYLLLSFAKVDSKTEHKYTDRYRHDLVEIDDTNGAFARVAAPIGLYALPLFPCCFPNE
jgi:hypothetical protein